MTPSSSLRSPDPFAKAREVASTEFRLNFSGYAAREEAEHLSHLLPQIPSKEVELHINLQARRIAALSSIDYKATQVFAHELDEQLADLNEAANPVTPISLSYAATARNISNLATADVHDRVRDTRHVVEICVQHDEKPLLATAFFLYLDALTQAGHLDAIDRELAPLTTVLGRHHYLLQGRHALWSRCMRATLDGRLSEAEQLSTLGFQVAQEEHDPDAQIVHVGQLAVIRWMQSRSGEVEPHLLQARQAFPHEPIWASSVAWIWLQQGRTTAARGMLNSLPAFSEFPRDRNWLAALAILAEVVTEVGTLSQTEELYEILSPLRGQVVPIGLGITCWGLVDSSLAILARGRKDYRRATEHLHAAIDTNSRLGAQVWLAQDQLRLAALVHKQDPENYLANQETIDLARQAAQAGAHLGLEELQVNGQRILQQLGVSETVANETTAAVESSLDKQVPCIEVLTSFTVTNVEHEVVRWRSRKAADLLKILVARRGIPIPREQVLEYLWPGVPPEDLANRFAVAISTARSSLDPERRYPRDHFISITPDIIALRTDRLTIDCETFLTTARRGTRENDAELLHNAISLYQDQAFNEDPYAPWSDAIRREVDATFCAASHALAEIRANNHEHDEAADLYQQIISIDEYDQIAHENLIAAFTAVGAHGRARTALERAQTAFEDLGIAFTAAI